MDSKRKAYVVFAVVAFMSMSGCRSMQPQGRPGVSRSESKPGTPPTFETKRKLDPEEELQSRAGRISDEVADRIRAQNEQTILNNGNQFGSGSLLDDNFVLQPNGVINPLRSPFSSDGSVLGESAPLPGGVLNGVGQLETGEAGVGAIVVDPQDSCPSGGCPSRGRVRGNQVLSQGTLGTHNAVAPVP